MKWLVMQDKDDGDCRYSVELEGPDLDHDITTPKEMISAAYSLLKKCVRRDPVSGCIITGLGNVNPHSPNPNIPPQSNQLSQQNPRV